MDIIKSDSIGLPTDKYRCSLFYFRPQSYLYLESLFIFNITNKYKESGNFL